MGTHEQRGGSHVKREREVPAEKTKRRSRQSDTRPAERQAAEETPRRKRTASPTREKKPAAAVKRQKAVLEPEEERRPAPKKRSVKKHRRARKKIRNTLILIASLALALLCGALYAGSCVSTGTTNLPHVYLDGIDVGGLTREQTSARLKAQGWDQAGLTPMRVQLPAGVSFEVDRLEAGSAMPLETAVDTVFAYGHSGNWLGDLFAYLRAATGGVKLGDFTKSLNESYVSRCVKDGLTEFAEATSGPTGYTVDKENEVLILAKGAGELKLDESRLTEAVRQGLLADEESIRYDALVSQPQMPDFEAIYRELEREPQDAHFVEGGWEVVDEVVGCTFGVEEAVQLWNAANWMETVRIPLNISYPAVTGESLRSMLFRDRLGSMTTYFPNSIANRISNIQLAASKLDGLVLNPGDWFSYNETIGERTEAAGFLMAAAYSNGEVVEELGGGVCQVSSTLYSAVLYAQLGIKSRDNHYFKVDYMDWGMDATVSWPAPDFKFANTRDYPIRIHTICDPVERYITVEIWGTDTDGTHVEFTCERYRLTDPTYTDTIIGWNVYLYANIYDADGNLLRVEERAPSTYYLHDEDIQGPHEPRGG